MQAESINRDGSEGPTYLVVADDPDVLFLAQAILTGTGCRVLVAGNAESAVSLLKLRHIGIHYVAMRAGMCGWERVEDGSLRRGATAWTFHACIQDGIILLKGLDSAAAVPEPGSHGCNGNAFAAG